MPTGTDWRDLLRQKGEKGHLVVICSAYGQPGDWGWADGDVNGDGMVDSGDLAITGGNFGRSATPVPEPASLGLLLAGGASVLRRRR